ARATRQQSRRNDRISLLDWAPIRRIGRAADLRPNRAPPLRSATAVRIASAESPRDRAATGLGARHGLPPVDAPRESRHQVCPISRLLFEQAAGGGIAFPTGSADARQVSTRREDRLRG